MAAAVRFRITKISASAPASIMALAESYSQLVPGNTGIRTFGRAVFAAGQTRVWAWKDTVSTGT